jgi:DNA helicase HerA-like ATPase
MSDLYSNGAEPPVAATPGLDLTAGAVVGRVVHVDPSRARIALAEAGMSGRVTVSDLVALDTDAGELCIALVEEAAEAENAGETPEIRVMLVGTFRKGEAGRPAAFRRGSGVYPHVGGACHLIEGKLLHEFMAILGEGVPADQRLVLGRFVAERETAAIADGDRLFQRHAALVGSTGAGKSWATATILERAGRLRNPNLIVFDMHGEYLPLCTGSDRRPPVARRFTIAGPGDLATAGDDALFLPYWLLKRDEVLALTLERSDPHASDQQLRFVHHVQRLKEATLRDVEREEALASFTADSPIPYRLDHLLSWLVKDDIEKIPQHPSGKLEPGPYMGRLTGLISRIEARIADPRYGFIFAPPEHTLEYDWLTEMATRLLETGDDAPGIKVIDFSEVPSDILPLVAGVLARLVYDVQFWMEPDLRTPVCFVCDEAHLYLPVTAQSGPAERAALDAFEMIAKEGRKYGVALMVVSQRPADVSRTILSQCNNFIVMRLTNDQDQAVIERLMPETLAGVTGVLPLLDIGEAVVLGDALLLPTRIRFDAPELQPASATQSFWTRWGEHGASRDGIAAGVEALRNQLRSGRSPERSAADVSR